MKSAELFDRFPDLLIAGFRKQMLLGKVPAAVVEEVLKPLLDNFFELIFELPIDLQSDFEKILRIYPELAKKAGFPIKPPLADAMRRFAEYMAAIALVRGFPVTDTEHEMAAEHQRRLGDAALKSLIEGQGFFTDNKGSSIFLEFRYPQGDDFAWFEYRPAGFPVEIHICGARVVSLSPQMPKARVGADVLAQVVREDIESSDIKIVQTGE